MLLILISFVERLERLKLFKSYYMSIKIAITISNALYNEL